MDFPTLLEWVEEVGFAKLHEQHADASKQPAPLQYQFTYFVELEYKEALKGYKERMRNIEGFKLGNTDHHDMPMSCALDIIEHIINMATEGDFVKDYIEENDLAPDALSNALVYEALRDALLPDLKAYLDDYGDDNDNP